MTDAVTSSYYIIVQDSKTEIKIKDSRFIGESFYADNSKQSLSSLQLVKRREHAASHNCYAYRVGMPENIEFKYSDDGEPGGSAGRPIYDVITGNNLSNVLVVVTRYFGGTKLGTGGLARAYSEAARNVLEESGSREVFLTRRMSLTLDFPLYDSLLVILRKHNVNTIESDFSDRVNLVIDVRVGQAAEFIATCEEFSSGKISIEEIDS